jgi:hypothetical protein
MVRKAPISAQPHHPPLTPSPGRVVLATSRYAASQLIQASGLSPVRITLGAPRFRLGYELAGEIPELAPSPRIFRLEWARFAPAYLHQLDRVDWRAVEEQLHAITAAAGTSGCVWLCFENVLRGECCHRRLLASHWDDRTGIRVDELAAQRPLFKWRGE